MRGNQSIESAGIKCVCVGVCECVCVVGGSEGEGQQEKEEWGPRGENEREIEMEGEKVGKGKKDAGGELRMKRFFVEGGITHLSGIEITAFNNILLRRLTRKCMTMSICRHNVDLTHTSHETPSPAYLAAAFKLPLYPS